MADSNPKTPQPQAPQPSSPAGGAGTGIRLNKEERKELLAEIERRSRRRESPGQILQRAEEALRERNLDRARTLLGHLETIAPDAAGLTYLQERLRKVESEEKARERLRQAEEMLTRYIQQRKKSLAELALEALLEIAPQHPRRDEYRIWVGELDQEVAMQRRIDEQLEAGRAAARAGEMKRAKKHLEALRKLDPWADATEELAAEIAEAEEEEAESADIERLKLDFEKLLEGRHFERAAEGIERLAGRDVPKVTLDFLRKRLEEARSRDRDRLEAEELQARYERALAARDWEGARETAREFGKRFPDRSDAAELFNRVTEVEAAERRKQSIEQGIATFEKLLAEGKRQEAEVALNLLERLHLDAKQLEQLRRRVAGS